MANGKPWDVVVVGGGPAGCACALRCAAAGLAVTLLEAAPRPRRRAGETLHPGVEPIFAQLGVREAVLAAGFHRHRGIWVRWNGPRRFEPYGHDASGDWLGFQAERAVLDRLLLDAARRAGVTVRQGVRANEAPQVRGRVIGVVDSDGKFLRARWVIDAAGGSHWLAAQLGLPVEPCGPPMRVRFGWRPGGEDDGPADPELSATPDGWQWQAWIRRGLVAWCRLSCAGADDAPETAGNLRWRFVARSCGPGYLMIGDAAAVCDPLSSHGVLRALMSGLLAGHWMATVAHGVADERQAAAACQAWVREQFVADCTRLRGLYGDRFPPDPLQAGTRHEPALSI